MISDQANKQNRAKQRHLETLGYKFCVGLKGWMLRYPDDTQLEGPLIGKGEQAHREAHDTMVLMAQKNEQKLFAKKITPPAYAKDTPIKLALEAAVEKATTQTFKEIPMTQDIDHVEPAQEEAKPKSLKHTAVMKAIGFLKASGAIFNVDFDGQNWNNIPKPDYASHYKPLIDKHKNETELSLTLPVPPEFDFDGYAVAVRSYLQYRYGAGSTVTETDRPARTFSFIASCAPGKE